VYVLRDGALVAAGTHDELLAAAAAGDGDGDGDGDDGCAHYRRLVGGSVVDTSAAPVDADTSER
jgi:hypothetical protein